MIHATFRVCVAIGSILRRSVSPSAKRFKAECQRLNYKARSATLCSHSPARVDGTPSLTLNPCRSGQFSTKAEKRCLLYGTLRHDFAACEYSGRLLFSADRSSVFIQDPLSCSAAEIE